MKERIYSIFKLSFSIFFLKTAAWYFVLFTINILKIDRVLYSGYIPMWGFDLFVTFWFYLLFSLIFFWILDKYGMGSTRYFTVVGISLLFLAFFGIEHFLGSEIPYLVASFNSYLIVILMIYKYWIPSRKVV